MAIDRHNYEVYLIDYLDGNLPPDQVEVLLVFLKNNPDIQEEFEGIKDAVLVNDDEQFPNKPLLKKNRSNFAGIETELDYFCIALIEGDITTEEDLALAKYISADTKNGHILNIYEQAHIDANLDITYPNKNAIKRHSIFNLAIRQIKLATGAAATILILIGGYGLMRLIQQDSIGITSKQPVLTVAIEPIKEKSVAKVPVKKEKAASKVSAVKINKQNLAINSTEIIITRNSEYYPILPTRTPSELKTQMLYEEKVFIKNIQPVVNFSNLAQDLPIDEAQKPASGVREIGFFEMAQMGLSSFGKLIGRDIKLDAKRNDKGKIKEIHFESSLIAFSAPVGKNEE